MSCYIQYGTWYVIYAVSPKTSGILCFHYYNYCNYSYYYNYYYYSYYYKYCCCCKRQIYTSDFTHSLCFRRYLSPTYNNMINSEPTRYCYVYSSSYILVPLFSGPLFCHPRLLPDDDDEANNPSGEDFCRGTRTILIFPEMYYI